MLSLCSYSRLFVPAGSGSELLWLATRSSPHMLGLRLTLKHCNCHISQELIWSEPEPVFLLSSSGPPRLRLYRRHSASGGRRHREHIPSLSSQSRHHNWTRFMELWSQKNVFNYPHFKIHIYHVSSDVSGIREESLISRAKYTCTLSGRRVEAANRCLLYGTDRRRQGLLVCPNQWFNEARHNWSESQNR